MSFTISYSEKFKKNYKLLTEQEKKLVINKIRIICENPTYPSLRTKRIQGTTNLFESSVNMDIRLIWYWNGPTIILMLDVGHHNVLDRY